jgi:Ca2+-binding RTX toxin-like protein
MSTNHNATWNTYLGSWQDHKNWIFEPSISNPKIYPDNTTDRKFNVKISGQSSIGMSGMESINSLIFEGDLAELLGEGTLTIVSTGSRIGNVTSNSPEGLDPWLEVNLRVGVDLEPERPPSSASIYYLESYEGDITNNGELNFLGEVQSFVGNIINNGNMNLFDGAVIRMGGDQREIKNEARFELLGNNAISSHFGNTKFYNSGRLNRTAEGITKFEEVDLVNQIYGSLAIWNNGVLSLRSLINKGGDILISDQGLLEVTGDFRQTRGSIRFPYQGDELGVIRSNRPFIIEGGTLEGIGIVDAWVINQASGSILSNNLTITDQLTNFGTVEVHEGDLSVNGRYVQVGGSTRLEDATLTGKKIILQGGYLGGVGTLKSDLIHTDGTVYPGLNFGTLNIGGNYSQAKEADLKIELGKRKFENYDRLNVEKTAILNGDINIVLADEFTPELGQAFDILNYDSIVGSPNIIGLEIGPSRSFKPEFHSSGLTLVVYNKIFGDEGNNAFDGTNFGDMIYGFGGVDTISAGPGEDFILGGRNNDVLTGGDGSDFFIIEPGDGTDTITDFTVGEDKVVLPGVSHFKELEITQGTGGNANDTLIQRIGQSEVLAILENINPASFSANSFILTPHLDLTNQTGTTKVGFQVGRHARFNNIVRFYEIDDPIGTVDGIRPGNPSYVETALSKLVEGIELKGSKGRNVTLHGSLEGGRRYAPVLFQNGNQDIPFFSYTAANFDGAEHIRSSTVEDVFGFEDLTGGDNDFNDLVVKVDVVSSQGELLIDLTGFSDDVMVGIDATLERHAAYNNVLHFYATDAQGSVNGLMPGEAGYENAVRTSLIDDVELCVANEQTIPVNFSLDGGSYYGLALAIKGETNNLVTLEDAFAESRPGLDGSNNEFFKFEDWRDNSFDDMVLTVNQLNPLPVI